MRLIHQITAVGDKVLAAAVAQYGELPKALKKAHPMVLTEALELAGGNFHRITAEEDGSLIVWNYPVW